jgi:hypothetical protein
MTASGAGLVMADLFGRTRPRTARPLPGPPPMPSYRS